MWSKKVFNPCILNYSSARNVMIITLGGLCGDSRLRKVGWRDAFGKLGQTQDKKIYSFLV